MKNSGVSHFDVQNRPPPLEPPGVLRIDAVFIKDCFLP